MERYLEGQEISHEEIVSALKDGTNHGDIFPVVCGVATRNLGTNRLLDAIVEDLPSPVKHGGLELPEVTLEPDPDAELFAYVFKTKADPFAGRINFFRVYQGTMRPDGQVLNTRAHAKERIGQLLIPEGKDSRPADAFGPGDIGAVAKLKETRAGDWLAARDEPIAMPAIKLPQPVMAFAMEPHTKGDEDKVFTALRRLQEEDPTIDLHRDPQTGEQIVAGLSQVHVEVVVDRLRSRFGAEVDLKPPRVPYRETIRSAAKAHGRHKKQTGGRGQFGDCHIEVEPLPEGDADFEFVDAIKGGVIPGSFIPAVEKGCLEALQHGAVAGFPVRGVRVRLFDGSFHSVDSSEMAFKMAGSQAMRQALEQAGSVLLEPIMLVTLSVPDDAVGDVIGDLNSRRGRPLGMEPAGRPDRGQGRGADGGDADLRPRPALADRRPGRLHDGAGPLRGGPGPPRAEGRGRAAAGRRGRPRLTPRGDSRPPSLSSTRRDAQVDPDERPRRLLRRLRAHAAAGRARRRLPALRVAADGLPAVHRPRGARGLDPRGVRRRHGPQPRRGAPRVVPLPPARPPGRPPPGVRAPRRRLRGLRRRRPLRGARPRAPPPGSPSPSRSPSPSPSSRRPRRRSPPPASASRSGSASR